jgi:hypothetical protein
MKLSARVKKTLVIAAIGAAGVFAAPAASLAGVTIYDGDDYAYNTGTTKVTVCDGEQDGHSAYSDYKAASNGRITTSGGKGTCNSASTAQLRSFNVCEQIPSFPDSCSSQVEP